MAVDYITGSKTAVTAAKLNQLWAEVDTIAGKALDEKSCLLVSDHTDRTLFGQPFYFFTASEAKIIGGLKAGLNATMADMVTYIERKMGSEWRKAGF